MEETKNNFESITSGMDSMQSEIDNNNKKIAELEKMRL